MAQISFTISARGKPREVPIANFLRQAYSGTQPAYIDSIFGFVEKCSLYGGRPFSAPDLNDEDIESMYAMKIGLRLPLTNHLVEREEYEQYRWLLEKYHRRGNSVIITNDQLARWIRRDFPRYRVEASVIKEIDTYRKMESAFNLYDMLILPMRCTQDIEFLRKIKHKKRITLFANAGCALTCPSKICYPAISKMNKFATPEPRFTCSFELKPREMQGMTDFDLKPLVELGFLRFKLLRGLPSGITGY